MTGSTNIFKNPDFEEWDGDCFLSWYGFGWCELRRGAKFRGKKSCETENRKHPYSGMAQDVTDVLKLGTRYEFTCHARLSCTQNENETQTIRVQLQYKLSNRPELCYLTICERQAGVLDWIKLFGIVPLPHCPPDCQLESAVIHFECPQVETDFLVAQVCLTEIPIVSDVSANLIRNPHFELIENDTPIYWEPFGNVKLSQGTELYDGGATCQTCQRPALWTGMGQDLVYELKLGRRYKFSAAVRLAADIPPSEKFRICCTLKLKLQNEKDERYQLFAVEDEVTSADWYTLKGQLNMPLGEVDSLMETAFLYFDGPPHDVNFMIGSVSLVDATPYGVRQQLEEREAGRKAQLPKEPVVEAGNHNESYPVVYLSYHMSSTNMVEELKKTLTHAGIKFIDVHRTRGDDLVNAIKEEIKRAQVVISCVTQEHCTDEIHQGEITLAHLRQMPICPLLLESLSWPPKCSAMKIYQKLKCLDFTRCESISQEMLEEFLTKIRM